METGFGRPCDSGESSLHWYTNKHLLPVLMSGFWGKELPWKTKTLQNSSDLDFNTRFYFTGRSRTGDQACCFHSLVIYINQSWVDLAQNVTQAAFPSPTGSLSPVSGEKRPWHPAGQTLSSSPCAELQQSHSQPAEFAISQQWPFPKSWQNLELFVQAVKKAKEGCAEEAMFHFPRDGRTLGDDQELLKLLRLLFFVLILVQSLLFLPSSLLTECFMALPLFPWALRLSFQTVPTAFSVCSQSVDFT